MGKILVAGGAGYVGSVLVEELLARGYAVRVLDRLYFGVDHLAAIRDRIELMVHDMRTTGPHVLEGIDAVINVGGLSNDPTAEYNPQANHEINMVASVELAKLCKKEGVNRYVFASSCSVYDRGIGDDERDILSDETTDVNPKAAYSRSKYEAERALIEMADSNFCPVILRKGTVYGFSPRMRYDLVINTFVKDSLTRSAITLHCGGEMWRPLVDVRDASRAYIIALEAEKNTVSGEIFNIAFKNMRISEVGLRVREALGTIGVEANIQPDYGYRSVRSYRVSTEKAERVLGMHCGISVEESVVDMVAQIRHHGYTDFENPKYYNIEWMRVLERASDAIRVTGDVFGAGKPPDSPVLLPLDEGR